MSIITLSRNAYSHGKEIAGLVAEEMGFRCIGPEIIEKAIQENPQIQGNKRRVKKKDIALFRSSFFENMAQDDVVYHGLSGHIFLHDIPNVLKVKLIADFDDRVAEDVKTSGRSYEEAKEKLMQDDLQRQVWSKMIFGDDALEPDPYDLSLNLHSLDVERAARIIVDTAKLIADSDGGGLQGMLTDLALGARIEAHLLDTFDEVQAEVRGKEAYVRVEGSIVQEEAIARKARKIIATIPGIKKANIGVIPSMYVPF